jgi:hypothetical protein
MLGKLPLLPLLASLSCVLARFEESTIEWGPCSEELQNKDGVQLECATLPVPLDYTKTSDDKLNLALAKISATREPHMGSIVVNPGGPGNSGRTHLAQEAVTMLV